MLRIGCCGFPVGLARYARELQVAEVQKTFYRIPKLDTIRRWRDAVPEEFTFTVKAWQGITHLAGSPTFRRAGPISDDVQAQLGHFRPTEPVFNAWTETREVADILRATVILLQAPPSFSQIPEHERNLSEFLGGIDRGKARIALELRAPWEREHLTALCRQYDLIHCVDPFREKPVTGAPFYLRLHGSPLGKRMYSYRYTGEDLRRLKDTLAGWVAEGDVYCLFNNLSLWQDSLAFRDLVKHPRQGSRGIRSSP